MDFAGGEYARYNNAALMFNAAYTAFANHYNRAHAPLGAWWVRV